MGFTFIAFEGYEIIVQTGEEVENPNTAIPKAIFYSLLIVVPIYFFVGLSSLVAITPDSPGTPTWKFLGDLGEIGLAEAARQFMPLGITLMLFGGLVSTLSALNATIYSSARVAFVMGRDRLLPKRFNEVNAWRRTPHWAIVVSGSIMIFVAIFLPLEDVAASADLLFVLLFLQVDISILRLRRKYEGKLFYGYQVPFFPYIPILAILAQIALGVALIVHFPIAMIGALIWLVFGTMLYYGYIKGHLETDISDAFAEYIRKPADVEKYGRGETPTDNLEELP
jgi:amino acid transporter